MRWLIHPKPTKGDTIFIWPWKLEKFLRLAHIYGYQPVTPYTHLRHVSKEEAAEFATALKCSIPDLPKEQTCDCRMLCKNLIGAFSGPDGRGEVEELIEHLCSDRDFVICDGSRFDPEDL